MEITAMKKSLVALAVLGAFGTSAFAQSSVTLFGVVDLNARHSSNGTDSTQTLSQDGLASSRIGLRGVEDLGGGMRAGFWLEGAINPDTGTPGGQTWQRRSTASLMGGFGEIRLGRDYAPTFWNATVFDPFGTNGVGAQSNVHAPHVGIGQFVRNNNSIGYFLPSTMGGLYGQVMLAAGEGVSPNKYVGGRVGFKTGPIDVAVAYGQNYVVPAVGGDDTAAIANIGAQYTLGPANLMGYYSRFTLGTSTRTNALIGGNVKFGPGLVRASYSRFTDNSAATDNGTQVAVGYVYDMSRRTALYGTVSRISNDTARAFSTGGLAAIAGKNHTGIEAGVRHNF
jgi:predicted porin